MNPDKYETATNAMKETPFTRLSGAVERLRKAQGAVASVAGKLVGETPEGCREANNLTGTGMFGYIEEMADTIAWLADDIESCATRIERRL